MISLPLGLLCFAMVLLFSAWGERGSDYINSHAFLVVFVGTFAVFLSGNSKEVIWITFQKVFRLFERRPSLENIRQDLVTLSRDRNQLKTSKDPLIQYAIVLWERGVDSHSFQALISQYRDKLETEDVEAISAVHNLSKYPPALGMLGTVMGMITLFANLGESDKSGIGPALAIAMTATFYGLFLANGIIMPVADRMHVEALFRKKYFGMVYEIITLINRREPTTMIEEEIEYRQAA